MIKIEFTPEEIDALEHERYHHPDPKVQKEKEALYLKSQGLEHQEVCRLCRISKTTLTTYLKQYRVYPTMVWCLEYILNYFDERLTSGFVEGMNNKIKLLKHIAFGFRNFDHFALWVRIECTPAVVLPH